MGLDTRRLALATGILGVLTIAIVLAFGTFRTQAEDPNCIAGNAVVQFEMATDRQDLETLFDKPGGRCRKDAVTAMDQSNRLDMYGFIPAYTALNIVAVLFLAGAWRRPLALAAIGAAVLAAGADYVETTRLLTITQPTVLDTDQALALLKVSTPAAITKFALLGLYGILIAAICITGKPRRFILGIALVLPAIATPLMIYDISTYYQAWVAAVAIAYISLTGFGFWKAFR